MNSDTYLALAKTDPRTPLLVFSPMIITSVGLALTNGRLSPAAAFALIIAGIILWTFLEYLLHRFPFHHETEEEPWKLLTSGFHQLHHQMPNRKDTVVAPIIITVPLYGLIFLLSWAILRNADAAGLLSSGVASGYLVYEAVHYFAHHGRPTGAIGRFLKQYHLTHHFRDHNHYFGVTTPFWDIVFSTKPPLPQEKK